MPLIVRCYITSRSQVFFILVGVENLQVFLLFHCWFLVKNEVETDEKLLFKESFRLYISNFFKKNIQSLNELVYMS